jgi:hypothetical protein
MLELVGVVLVVVGTYLAFRSAAAIAAANKGVVIPWTGRIDNQPPSAMQLRWISGALVIVGGLCLFGVIGAGIIPLVFVTTASPLLVFVVHNRRLGRSDSA